MHLVLHHQPSPARRPYACSRQLAMHEASQESEPLTTSGEEQRVVEVYAGP